MCAEFRKSGFDGTDGFFSPSGENHGQRDIPALFPKDMETSLCLIFPRNCQYTVNMGMSDFVRLRQA